MTTTPLNQSPPGPVDATVGPDAPAAAALAGALAEGERRLAENLPRALAGDPEGAHELRTTTRRLRAVLSAFRGLTGDAWSSGLAADLKWLGGALRDVRDLDVLRARLAADADDIDGGTMLAALGPLFVDLEERRRAAARSLDADLRGDRLAGLRGALAGAAGRVDSVKGADAWGDCGDALPSLLAPSWRALRKAGRALEPSSPDEAFHDVRKKARRARYATEAVAKALGTGSPLARAAGRFARAARDVQDVLGAHQDATIAGALLREAAEERLDLGTFNLAAGRLIEREALAAAAARARFFKAWKALDRKKRARWIKGRP